jgi:hypothetical protein
LVVLERMVSIRSCLERAAETRRRRRRMENMVFPMVDDVEWFGSRRLGFKR